MVRAIKRLDFANLCGNILCSCQLDQLRSYLDDYSIYRFRRRVKMRAKKSFIVQSKMKTKKRGLMLRDSQVRVLGVLSKRMDTKLKAATSTRRDKHLITDKLKLSFLGCKPGQGSRLGCVQQVEVPLITDKREKNVIEYWHEVTAKNLEYKVMEASKKIEPMNVKRSRAARLEACCLKPVTIPCWRKSLHDQFIEKSIEEMQKHNLPPVDPYMPLGENQRRILDGRPIIKSETSKTSDNSFTIDKTIRDVKILRQTKIDEYFFPRSLYKSV